MKHLQYGQETEETTTSTKDNQSGEKGGNLLDQLPSPW